MSSNTTSHTIVIYGKGKAMKYLCELLDYLKIVYIQMDDEDADVESIASADYIIATPGIKPSHRLYMEYGQKIVSELSFLWLLKQWWYFSWRNHNIKIIGITGTNGKSTTTWMMYQMLELLKPNHYFLSQSMIHIGGNFDKPLSGIIHSILLSDQTQQQHIIVLEVSSFMLWKLQSFRFDIGIFLNLARDHQDRHKDMSDYLLAKANILFQADIAITSSELYNDLTHIQYHSNLAGKAIRHVVRTRLKKMIIWLFGRRLQSDQHFLVYHAYEWLANLAFIGEHNKRNAGAIDLALQQLIGSYDHSLRSQIPALPHRLQLLAPIDGIALVDDAICTSAHAMMTALQSQSSHVVLVCGGYDAGDDYTILQHIFVQQQPHIVVYGQIGPTIYALAKQRWLSCQMVSTLEESLTLAVEIAKNSSLTTILFSPGSKSFDLFDNVYHRIRVFEETVEQLRTTNWD